jgi:hypothetical protein
MSHVLSQALLGKIRASQKQLLRSAARGWLYALYIDYSYLAKSDSKENLSLGESPLHKPSRNNLEDKPVEHQDAAYTLDILGEQIATTDYPPAPCQPAIEMMSHRH